jgi:nucleotide-binding universal stress UspA family protein
LNIKKILCPTDFSDQAYEALLAAADLAGDYSAELLVVHVVESLPTLLGGGNDPVAQFQECCWQKEKEGKELLEHLVNRRRLAKIKVKTLIEIGHPAIQILDWAEEYEVDLIVIATHGQTGWRRALLGSVTERIIKLTTRPVWIIQPKPPARSLVERAFMKLRTILCPTDFSESADEALKSAASLAGDYSAELLVAHVVESLSFVPGAVPTIEAAAVKNLEAVVERLISTKVQVRHLVKCGQPAVQIVDLAEKNEADLIVIATHGLTGWRRASLGSVTDRVIKQTTKPMLVMQTKSLGQTPQRV